MIAYVVVLILLIMCIDVFSLLDFLIIITAGWIGAQLISSTCNTKLNDYKSSYYTGGGSKLISFKLTNTKQNLNHTVDLVACEGIDPKALEMFKSGAVPKLIHADKIANYADFKITIDDYERIPYQRRINQFKRVVQLDALAALLSDVEFLTTVIKHRDAQYKEDIGKISTEQMEIKSKKKQIYVIYTNSVAKPHMYLVKLFPDIHFELYNTHGIEDTDFIKVHNQLFDEKDATYWQTSSPEHSNKYIVMNIGKRLDAVDLWKIVNPEFTIIKFKLPWESGYTEYPSGSILTQPYSGETRLLIKKEAQITQYDHKQYEEQLFYHNDVIRNMRFMTPLGKLDIRRDYVDNCYDCTRFVKIVSDYLELFHNSNSGVKELVKTIQNALSSDVYEKTIESFNKSLAELYAQCFKRCDKPKCSLCVNRIQYEQPADISETGECVS